MSFLPPPSGNLDPEIGRAEQQAIELQAEQYAQTHLPEDERGTLGTKPQRLLHRLIERLRGRR
jgi:hypothetical protein